MLGVLSKNIGPLPEGLQVTLRFDEDSTGAPAAWIVLLARNDLKPNRETLEAIRHVAEKYRSEFRRLNTERWPYIEIQAA